MSDEQVEKVVIQTLESTPRGETNWSTRGLAKASGLSRMTISRIWHAFGSQPVVRKKSVGTVEGRASSCRIRSC